MAGNDQAKKFYDNLIESYDVLVDSVSKATERGVKVTKQMSDDIAKGQRDLIELGKKVASEPGDVTQLYGALLETATAAQGRALAFSQLVYQESAGSGTDVRESFERLTKMSTETTAAAVDMARAFAGANPFAEVMAKGMEAFTAPAKGTGKTK